MQRLLDGCDVKLIERKLRIVDIEIFVSAERCSSLLASNLVGGIGILRLQKYYVRAGAASSSESFCDLVLAYGG